jgi:pimeloyl-ACP methyl ester carboxylesterase
MDYDNDFYDGKANTAYGGMHYRHHESEGRTIIFLHGLGASITSWKKLMGAMPFGYNIYLVDLLGHGGSDAPEMHYTIKKQAQALEDLISDQRLDEPVLFGHSYGGWVAAYYAAQHSIGALVLEDAVGLKEAFDQIVAGKREDDYKRVFLKEAMETVGNKEYVIKSILDSDFEGDQLDEKMLNGIGAPTLILWGKNDLMMSADNALIFKKNIKNSEIEILDDAGHVPHFTKPAEVARAIQEFFGKH